MEAKELKSIYEELSKNNVVIEKQKLTKRSIIHYTFGRYIVSFQNYGRGYKFGHGQKFIGIYEHIQGGDYSVEDWDSKMPCGEDNDVYRIYIAAKNKYDGKGYIDPYKTIISQNMQQRTK